MQVEFRSHFLGKKSASYGLRNTVNGTTLITQRSGITYLVVIKKEYQDKVMKLSCIPQTHILLYLNQPLRWRYLYFNENSMVLEAHVFYMQWQTELLRLCVYTQQGCSYHTARVCIAWGPTSLSLQIIVFTLTEHCPLSGQN